jgi:hypothetical protein
VIQEIPSLDRERNRFGEVGQCISQDRVNCYKKAKPHSITWEGLGMVGHTCNPSYLGGGDRRTVVQS